MGAPNGFLTTTGDLLRSAEGSMIGQSPPSTLPGIGLSNPVLQPIPTTQNVLAFVQNMVLMRTGMPSAHTTPVDDEEAILTAMARLSFHDVTLMGFNMLDIADDGKDELELMAEVRAYFEIAYMVSRAPFIISKLKLIVLSSA